MPFSQLAPLRRDSSSISIEAVALPARVASKVICASFSEQRKFEWNHRKLGGIDQDLLEYLYSGAALS